MVAEWWPLGGGEPGPVGGPVGPAPPAGPATCGWRCDTASGGRWPFMGGGQGAQGAQGPCFIPGGVPGGPGGPEGTGRARGTMSRGRLWGGPGASRGGGGGPADSPTEA